MVGDIPTIGEVSQNRGTEILDGLLLEMINS